MQGIFLGLLALFGRSSALDCKAEGIEWLDNTLTLSNSTSTPPTTTDFTVYINPCGSAQGDDQCESDDHFCVVESITEGSGRSAKTIVTGIKPFGSKSQGAIEAYSRGPQRIIFNYDGASWGNSKIHGSIEVACGSEDTSVVEISDPLVYKVHLTSAKLCSKEKVPDKTLKKQPPKPQKGNWGLFTWIFVLLIFAGIAYAALTVYINFAQSRGNLPLAADIGDVLRDLPYLLRDIFSKLNFMGSRSSSGYAAL